MMTREDLWTDAEKATLRKLWKKGLPASQIARELPGRTRNAVIGQAHRMGLPARRSPIVRRPTKAWGMIVPHLMKAPPQICDWPGGCTNKRDGRTSYCTFHNAIARRHKGEEARV